MTPFEKILQRALVLLSQRGPEDPEYIEALLLAAKIRAYGSNTGSCGVCGGKHRSRDCTVSN